MLVSLVQSKIKCADELKLDTCYLEGKEGETRVTYVKACGGGKVCREYGNIGICVKPKELRNEDEKCTSPLECRSGICTDNKCAIKKENDSCDEYKDECGKSAICRNVGGSNVCKPLSGKDGECDDDDHCQIGLICLNNKCIERFSLDVGSEANRYYACKTGYSKGGKCVNYIAVDKTCTKATNGSEGMYCKTKTNDETSDSETIEDECDTNWNDEYICPTEAYSKWDKYVEEFKKRYDKLSDDDKKDKYINRDTLNKNKVRNAYAEFEHYSEINFDDDCIKEYYQQLSSSHYLSLSLFFIFLFMFLLN